MKTTTTADQAIINNFCWACMAYPAPDYPLYQIALYLLRLRTRFYLACDEQARCLLQKLLLLVLACYSAAQCLMVPCLILSGKTPEDGNYDRSNDRAKNNHLISSTVAGGHSVPER